MSARIPRAVPVLGALGLAWALAGCAAGIKSEQLSDELAQLREEFQSADEQLSSRIDELSGRTDRLERELQSLRNDYNVTVERMRGMMRFNVPVHFAFDDATIRETDKPILDRFGAVVKEFYPDALITIEGFADPAGSSGYNLTLGQRRAEAVMKHLEETAGLDADRLRAVSYGEAPRRQVRPGAHGPGPEGLDNRRVALVIDYSGEGAAITASDS